MGYQWSLQRRADRGADFRTLVLPPPLTDANAGTYTVAATANGTTSPAPAAVLTVVDPPVFTAQPQGQTVAAGNGGDVEASGELAAGR